MDYLFCFNQSFHNQKHSMKLERMHFRKSAVALFSPLLVEDFKYCCFPFLFGVFCWLMLLLKLSQRHPDCYDHATTAFPQPLLLVCQGSCPAADCAWWEALPIHFKLGCFRKKDVQSMQRSAGDAHGSGQTFHHCYLVSTVTWNANQSSHS